MKYITVDIPLWFAIFVLILVALILIHLVLSDIFAKLFYRLWKESEVREKMQNKNLFYVNDKEYFDVTKIASVRHEVDVRNIKVFVVTTMDGKIYKLSPEKSRALDDVMLARAAQERIL